MKVLGIIIFLAVVGGLVWLNFHLRGKPYSAEEREEDRREGAVW